MMVEACVRPMFAKKARSAWVFRFWIVYSQKGRSGTDCLYPNSLWVDRRVRWRKLEFCQRLAANDADGFFVNLIDFAGTQQIDWRLPSKTTVGRHEPGRFLKRRRVHS